MKNITGRPGLFAAHRPLIAVPFSGPVDAAVVRRLVKQGMDVAELRVDLLPSTKKEDVLREAKKFGRVPLLATIRSKKEGGRWKGSEKERLDLYRALLPLAAAVDVEWSSKEIVREVLEEARRLKKTSVVSFHDFEKTPDPAFLLKLVRGAKTAGADVVKIAVMARSKKDMRAMADFTFAHAPLGLITLSMGKAGELSRLFFPGLGSLLTFAHAGKRTAPGQLDLATTAACFRRFHGPR